MSTHRRPDWKIRVRSRNLVLPPVSRWERKTSSARGGPCAVRTAADSRGARAAQDGSIARTPSTADAGSAPGTVPIVQRKSQSPLGPAKLYCWADAGEGHALWTGIRISSREQDTETFSSAPAPPPAGAGSLPAHFGCPSLLGWGSLSPCAGQHGVCHRQAAGQLLETILDVRGVGSCLRLSPWTGWEGLGGGDVWRNWRQSDSARGADGTWPQSVAP